MRLFHRHLRIWIGLALGIGAFLLLPGRWTVITRLLTGWDFGVTLFLVMIYLWMRRLTAEQIRSRYIEEDPSGPVILVAVSIAALLSLLAIVEPLATLRQAAHAERVWRFALAGITLADSWLLMPTMFTMH